MFQKSAERWQTGRVLSVFADHLVRVHDELQFKSAAIVIVIASVSTLTMETPRKVPSVMKCESGEIAAYR